MKIYDEKFQWRGKARIDSHNEEAIERLKSAPKPVVRNISPSKLQLDLSIR